MQNSVTLALFTDNSTILADSMTRALSEMTVSGSLGIQILDSDLPRVSLLILLEKTVSIAMVRSFNMMASCTTATMAKIW